MRPGVVAFRLAIVLMAVVLSSSCAGSPSETSESGGPSAPSSDSIPSQQTTRSQSATALTVETSTTVPSNVGSGTCTLNLIASYARLARFIQVETTVVNLGPAPVVLYEPEVVAATADGQDLSSATDYTSADPGPRTGDGLLLQAGQDDFSLAQIPTSLTAETVTVFWFDGVEGQPVNVSDMPVLR